MTQWLFSCEQVEQGAKRAYGNRYKCPEVKVSIRFFGILFEPGNKEEGTDDEINKNLCCG